MIPHGAGDLFTALHGQLVGERAAQAADAGAHLGELLVPLIPEFAVAENGRHEHRAPRGRHGDQCALDGPEMALHGLGGCRIRTGHTEESDTLAVKGEVLGAGHGEHDFGAELEAFQEAVGVLAQATTQAEIGEVDEGREPALGQQGDELVPFGLGEVGSSRVVATAV